MDPHEVPAQTPLMLIIDDERGILDFIQLGMRKEGFRIELAQDGPTGLSKARTLIPDIVILDIMLPGVDGFNICRQLRESPATADIPIIMLTAKDDVSDRVKGLSMGADDYLPKPFDFSELLARVQALMRRHLRSSAASGTSSTQRILKFGEITLTESSREVKRGERLIELTVTEYNLLHLLLSHPKQVLDRMTILDRVWGYDFTGETNIIEVYVRYLREKIEDDPSSPKYIQTVRGVGYVLKGP